MHSVHHPLVFLLLLISGWENRRQQAVVDSRPRRTGSPAAHAGRRVRLTDDQRRRLAMKGCVLGRRRLAEVSGIVTPDTILRRYSPAASHAVAVRSSVPGQVHLSSVSIARS